MKISFTILTVVAAATVVSANTAKFEPVAPKAHSPSEKNVVPNSYIIEYKDGYDHSAIRDAITNHNVNFKVDKQYSVFNGASIQVHSDHSDATLAKILGIKNVFPVVLYQIPKVTIQETPIDFNSPSLTSAHNLTGVTQVHSQYGYTGKGVKVGIIDTGIDYTHPALGGCFGPKCRVRWGWDFAGDQYTGQNTPIPDSDPMDCQGHGTHVAGIIGANAMAIQGANAPRIPFVGVAPEVHFGSYRVFGCSGTASTSVIMAAMEKAKADGMNIINLSLGGGPDFKDNPLASLADTLIMQGMHVIVAAGNDGVQGVNMVSDAGLSDLATSVASFENSAGFYYTFKFGGKHYPYLPSLAWNKAIDLPLADTLVALLDATGALSTGCDATDYNGYDVANKVVLLAHSTVGCAAGALFVSYTSGLATIQAADNFPAGSVEQNAGAALIALAKSAPSTKFTWNSTLSLIKLSSGDVPSTFSSWGLDSELRQKPDISAPGGKIYSTYPLAKGGYVVMSGTSMATPYVVGSHALYIQAKNKLSRSDTVRDVFKNTARNTDSYNTSAWVPTIKQGAGMINVLAAIQTTTSILPAKIDLLDSDHFVKTGVFTLKNHGNATETYVMSHQFSDSVNSYPTGGTFPLPSPKLEKDHAMVHFDKKTVTLKPGYSTKIVVNFDLPTTGDPSQFPIYSGFITATPVTIGNVAVHVPYAGLLGSVAKIPIQDRNFGVPLFKKFDSGEMVVYSRHGQATLDIQVSVHDEQDTFLGYMVDYYSGTRMYGREPRMPNWAQDGITPFYLYNFFGGLIVTSKDPKEVPVSLPINANYTIKLASQRMFSKGDYPADYEVWNLATFYYTGMKP